MKCEDQCKKNKKNKQKISTKIFVGISSLVLLLSLFLRLHDWQNRVQHIYGDKARDIFIAGLLANGHSLSIGHTASGLINPMIHYPNLYYYFLSIVWMLAPNPINFIKLLAIFHGFWTALIIFICQKVTKNYLFSLLIGLWYAISYLWVSVALEVVGVRVAAPLFLVYFLLWYGFEKTKKEKFLILSGTTAALISIFHYSIIPAIICQLIVIFITNVRSFSQSLKYCIVLGLSFLSSFVLLHTTQISFYGINSIIYSWLHSGTSVSWEGFLHQIIYIMNDQIMLLFYPQSSLTLSKIVLIVTIIFSITLGKFSKKLLLFLIIFLLLAATRKEYFEPYFTPGRVALTFFILVTTNEVFTSAKKKGIKILATAILLIYLTYSSSFTAVRFWKTTEFSDARILTSRINSLLTGYQYQLYAFDEDPWAWDTSILALSLWFDCDMEWFKTVNYSYNFEYIVPDDVVLLVCRREEKKPCTEFWNSFIRYKHYDERTKQYLNIQGHDILTLCKKSCPDTINSIENQCVP